MSLSRARAPFGIHIEPGRHLFEHRFVGALNPGQSALEAVSHLAFAQRVLGRSRQRARRPKMNLRLLRRRQHRHRPAEQLAVRCVQPNREAGV